MATLIYYDEFAHKAAQREAADVAARFTEVLKLYQALSLPEVVTADLPTLVANPSEWVLSKYTAGQSFQFGELTLNPAKVLEMMVRPAGFNEFVEAATWLGEDLGVLRYPDAGPQRYHDSYDAVQSSNSRPSPPHWANYFIKQAAQYIVVGGWEVQVAKESAKKLESLFKSYATSPKQEKILAALKTVCEGLSSLPVGVLAQNDTLLGQGSLKEALVTGSYGEVPVRPNPQFILKYS